MKKSLFPIVLLCIGAYSHAQHDIFALTGKTAPQIIFNDFRSLDVKSGASGETFLTADSNIKVLSQTLNTELAESRASLHHAQAPSMAALAYDQSGNDLIFSPMYSSNIYVLDAKTRQITLVENTAIKTTTCDLGSHITRMTAGYDGNIYALSNSGSQLIRISKTSGKYAVTDLGSIRDVSADPSISLGITQTGFGGDMVADAHGDFYIFSASGNVFKLSSKNRTSEFIGKITGLPQNYSLNGAAVNAEGSVIVASAKAEGFYEVNIDNLTAKPLNNGLNLHIYDLASRYFTHDSNARVTTSEVYSGIDVYPTKVKSGPVFIRISDKNVLGFTVDLYDSSGVRVLSKGLQSGERLSEHALDVANLKSGLYIITISNETGKQLLSKKILIE